MAKITVRLPENIEVGTTYKTFKELCEAFSVPKKYHTATSNSKTAVLKQVERFIEYDHPGWKYIVTKIYDEPLPDINGQQEGAYVSYAKLLMVLFLLNCNSTKVRGEDDYREYNLTVTNWLKVLQFCNQKYKDKASWADLTEKFKKSEIYDFYNMSDNSLTKSLKSVLSSLQRQNFIQYSYENIIVENDGYQRLASDIEKPAIMKAERDILDDMGYRDKFSVNNSRDKEDFYQKVVTTLKNDDANETIFYKQLEEQKRGADEETKAVIDRMIYKRDYPGAFDKISRYYNVIRIVFSVSSLEKHLDQFINEYQDQLEIMNKLEDDMRQLNTNSTERFQNQIDRKYPRAKIGVNKKRDSMNALLNELIFIESPQIPVTYKEFLQSKMDELEDYNNKSIIGK